MKQDSTLRSLGRSSTAPNPTLPPETSSSAPSQQTPQDTVERTHVRRASSISFAPSPMDRAFVAPGPVSVPKLDVASIGAVTRNFVGLGHAYESASPEHRDAAFERLVRAGSRMFADYLEREADSHPKSTWTGRGIRALNNRFRHDLSSRATVLGELTALRINLQPFAGLIDEANDRRNLIHGDVKQFVERAFGAHALKRTPRMEGSVLGCMLLGATLTLQEVSGDEKRLADFGAVLIAFGNALEKAFGGPATGALTNGKDALQFWSGALSGSPKAILERYEQAILQERSADASFMDGVNAARASYT